MTRRRGFGAMAVKCGKWETEYPSAIDRPGFGPSPSSSPPTYRRGCVANGNQIEVLVLSSHSARAEAQRARGAAQRAARAPWHVKVWVNHQPRSTASGITTYLRYETVAKAKQAADWGITRWKQELGLMGR
jgi:hypothetical protein